MTHTTQIVTDEMIEATRALLRAKKLTQTMRELSTAYENKVLREWGFYNNKTGDRITNVKDIPAMGDKQLDLFIQMADAEKANAEIELPSTKSPEKIIRKGEIECATNLFNLIPSVSYSVNLFSNIEVFEQVERDVLEMVTQYCSFHKIELTVKD